MNAKISVIVPVYNTKLYLKEAIDSVITQKDFVHEIIIINDGSTDGSAELIEGLYSNFDFIKIIHTKNQRQGPARNLGTKVSSGDFIYYFDSDDILRPNLFETFQNLMLDEPNLELFCFSAEPFLDISYSIEVETKNSLLSTKPYYRNVETNCDLGEEAFNLLSTNYFFSPLPYLYIFKKSILQRNNIEFRSIRFEDEEFTHQLFLFANKTLISNTIYCDRRIREGSTMQLNRCFDDILGYIKTIEILQTLKMNKKFKIETQSNLQKKILKLVENIIKIKASSNLKLTKDEKKIYKNSLEPLINNNLKLFILYHTYDIEYKFRLLKKRIFN